MATAPRASARLEARIDPELDRLIARAARQQGVSKTAFVSEAVRKEALKTIARTDVTWMSAQLFDDMMGSLEAADDSRELSDLAAMPRRITR